MQSGFKERIHTLERQPVLAILSVGTDPSTASFVRIKKKYAETIGVNIEEFNFKDNEKQGALISKILELAESDACDGIIVQLPLPPSFNTRVILDAIPENCDVDVLGSAAAGSFEKVGTPVPPVAGAVAHTLKDTNTKLDGKNIVVVGRGKLVGAPVATWFMHQGITPRIIDINTDEETKTKLLKEADIVISGVGNPKMLKPEHFKKGVALIDAGTSEQGGVLAGDCDPACAEHASVFTPIPGGVGPLTVACLFENIISFAEKLVEKRILT